MKKYGVALIGCGQMGEVHLSRIYCKENVCIKFLCDKNLSKAEDLKRKYFGENISDNVEECILSKDVDIVIIATYPSTHLELLKLCLENGKHVICEKPITNNLEDGRDFVNLVKQHPECKVLIGHILRHNITYKTVAKMIQNGDIGFPIIMRMVQNHHTMNWERYLNLIKETSPIIDCGVHYMDVMRWFTGEEITEVSAIGSRTEKDVPEDKYNYGFVTVKLSNGSIGFYEAGWGNTISADNLKEFIGPKGRIKITYQKDRLCHQEEGDLIEYYTYPEKEYKMINIQADRKPTDAQFDYLINMIENGVEAEPTIENVFNSFCVVWEADKKIKEELKGR